MRKRMYIIMYSFIILAFSLSIYLLGYLNGKTSGYEEGYYEGNSTGYELGYIEGEADGYKIGYAEAQILNKSYIEI